METAAKVRKIISEQLDVQLADVRDEASFVDDLGADSLTIVELILTFEERFQIDMPDHVAEKIRTVADVLSYIEENTSSH